MALALLWRGEDSRRATWVNGVQTCALPILLYGLDGFAWGEPNFAALSNTLPDRRCSLEAAVLRAVKQSSAVDSDGRRFWRRAGSFLVVADTATHSVYRVPTDGSVEPKEIETLFNSPRQRSVLTCGGGA